MVETPNTTNNNTRSGVETSSPGGSFTASSSNREGFANNPHIADDNMISESGADIGDVRDAGGDRGIAYGGQPNIGGNLAGSLSERFSGVSSTIRDQASRLSESVQGSLQGLPDQLRDLPARSRDVMSKLDTHARANPWLHIGIVGASALFLGYALGRSTSTRSGVVGSYTTSMGSGYEDFDDALDE